MTKTRTRRFALIAGGAAFGVAALLAPAVAANAAPAPQTAVSVAQSTEMGRLAGATVLGIGVTFTNNTTQNIDVTVEHPSAMKKTLTPGQTWKVEGQSASGYDINGQIWYPNGKVINWQGYAPVVGWPSVVMDDTRYRLAVDEWKQGVSKDHWFNLSRGANYYHDTHQRLDGETVDRYRAGITVTLTA